MKTVLAPRYVDAFVAGTTHTICTLCACEIRCLGSQDGRIGGEARTRVITGTIDVVDEKSRCQVSISLPENTFIGIQEQMFGEECLGIDSENSNCAGELMNIIFGHAKKQLNSEGFQIQLALPRVSISEAGSAPSGHPPDQLVLHFTSPMGPFFLSLVPITRKENSHV